MKVTPNHLEMVMNYEYATNGESVEVIFIDEGAKEPFFKNLTNSLKKEKERREKEYAEKVRKILNSRK